MQWRYAGTGACSERGVLVCVIMLDTASMSFSFDRAEYVAWKTVFSVWDDAIPAHVATNATINFFVIFIVL